MSAAVPKPLAKLSPVSAAAIAICLLRPSKPMPASATNDRLSPFCSSIKGKSQRRNPCLPISQPPNTVATIADSGIGHRWICAGVRLHTSKSILTKVGPNPFTNELAPSSLIIVAVAGNKLLYFSGFDCIRVLTTSMGHVMPWDMAAQDPPATKYR